MISKLPFLLLALSSIAVACASSSDQSSISEQYPDLVEVTPPEGTDVQQASVYIDSVSLINNQSAVPSLLIKGNFPDGCTHIGQADHELMNQRPSLTIRAWRNQDEVCTQALVSFSFIYDELPGVNITALDSILINSTFYPVNR